MKKRSSAFSRIMLVLFVLLAVCVCGSIVCRSQAKLNGDQYSWRIEGIMERISEKESELSVLYDEYWTALREQREAYAQEAAE